MTRETARVAVACLVGDPETVLKYAQQAQEPRLENLRLVQARSRSGSTVGGSAQASL